MTRKKLNLSYIDNDSMRKSTFNKRKKGLVKKIHELSVLCGIEACAVIYSPLDSTDPEVWPSNSGAKNVVEKFEMLTEMEQEKKMVNHEDFLKQNISKAVGNNNKKKKDNAERTMKEAMFQLLSGQKLQLTDRNREDLCKYIDQYLKELYHHRNETRKTQSHIDQYGESSQATNVVAPTSIVEVSSYSFPLVTNDLWSLRPIISSSQKPEGVTGNHLTNAADQQDYYPVMNPVSSYDQNPNFNHLSHDQYGYPIVPQDGIQNQNQQEEWI